MYPSAGKCISPRYDFESLTLTVDLENLFSTGMPTHMMDIFGKFH